MAFSGDKPIVETFLFDESGSALALPNSASIDLLNQPGALVAGVYGVSSSAVTRLIKVGPNGEVFVTGSLDANVTLDNGSSLGDPLYVSGTVHVDNTQFQVTFPSPQPITGSVTISSPTPLPVTGSVEITTVVQTTPVAVPNSSVVLVPISLSSVTLASANAARKAAYVYNTSNKHLLVKLGTTATTGSFTHKVFADAGWEIPGHYTGIITGVWPSGSNGNAMVTELT